jgi:hypothetical protein
MKKAIVITTILTIMSSGLFANEANDSTSITNGTNPFYPQYLKENITHAVDALVGIQLRDERAKIAKLEKELEKKEREKKINTSIKNKKTYAKIPSTIQVSSLTRNKLGQYSLKTSSGSVLKVGKSIYGGKITNITSDTISIARKEFGKTKKHTASYNVAFN